MIPAVDSLPTFPVCRQVRVRILEGINPWRDAGASRAILEEIKLLDVADP